MIKIKIKQNEKKFYIPIPYTMVNFAITILSSNLLKKKINQKFNQTNELNLINASMATLDKKQLKIVVEEVKRYKGLEIVKVKDKTGSEVTITL